MRPKIRLKYVHTVNYHNVSTPLYGWKFLFRDDQQNRACGRPFPISPTFKKQSPVFARHTESEILAWPNKENQGPSWSQWPLLDHQISLTRYPTQGALSGYKESQRKGASHGITKRWYQPKLWPCWNKGSQPCKQVYSRVLRAAISWRLEQNSAAF